MTTRVTLGTTGFACILLLCPTAWTAPAHGAPAVLRSADVQVTLTTPTTCSVELSVAIDGAPATVEHRLEILEGATITLLDTLSVASDPPRDLGRTRALTVRPSTPTYVIKYRVQQPPHGRFRCPLWLPTTPADGRSRAVRLAVSLPPGAEPSGTMPAFTWRDGVGTTTLGHLPAFVRVPYAANGAPAPWNLARLMDGVSVGVLVVASLLWLRRTRRAPPSAESPR
jgi:hypothetical protein